MKILLAFIAFVAAIFIATKGVNLLSEPSNTMVIWAICYIILAILIAFVTVKLLLKNKS